MNPISFLYRMLYNPHAQRHLVLHHIEAAVREFKKRHR